MNKHACANKDVKIVEITNSTIDAICEKCGKTGHANREDYFDFEWNKMLQDAKTKHEMISKS